MANVKSPIMLASADDEAEGKVSQMIRKLTTLWFVILFLLVVSANSGESNKDVHSRTPVNVDLIATVVAEDKKPC